MKRIIASLILVSVLWLSLCSCLGQKKYTAGEEYVSYFSNHRIKLKIESDTNKIQIDNIVLDFYYGFDEKEELERSKSEQNTIYAIYISASYHYNQYVEDYRNMEQAIFIKDYTVEDALTNQCYYDIVFDLGKLAKRVDYYHSEKLTIPEWFVREYSLFDSSVECFIHIVEWYQLENGMYSVLFNQSYSCPLTINIIDADHVKIIF